MKMTANNKIVIIIMVCRITDGSNHRIYIVKTQLDKVGKEVKTAKKHRTELLRDLTIFIIQQQAKAVVLASNLNENVYLYEIE